MFKFFHYQCFTSEKVFIACTTGRPEQYQLIEREIPLLKHLQELLSYSAARTNNSDSHN
jgi:hypothetical protein